MNKKIGEKKFVANFERKTLIQKRYIIQEKWRKKH